MSGLRLPEPPSASGAYRWLYADVVCGDVTAVFIFMMGSLFSPRYAAAVRRGGKPLDHCAVNFARYRGGARRQWVLSEYAGAIVAQDGRALRIGRSSLRYGADGTLLIHVHERTAPWGRLAEARLELSPKSPPFDELALDAAGRHLWQPLAVRAEAKLTLPREGVTLTSHGYHDTNHGAEPLGRSVTAWRWARVHRADRTFIHYHLEGEPHPIEVTAGDGLRQVIRGAPPAPAPERTAWGLRIPRHAPAGEGVLPSGRLLESAPFYARFEFHQAGAHVLGEVADFRRFHSPFIRWMAHFRTRVEAAA